MMPTLASPRSAVTNGGLTARRTEDWIDPMVSAQRLAKSGGFDGATAEQLYARIEPGRRLGLSDVVACCNIVVSRSKATYSAAVQGMLLAQSERYDYEVLDVTDEKASIRFFRDGKEVGVATFTYAEAVKAGLTFKQVWQFYRTDLLYARALSRGVRRFCPDLLLGNAALTAEEIGADVHGGTVADPTPAPSVNGTSPTPPAVKDGITDQQIADLKCQREALQIPLEEWRKILAKRNVTTARDLSREQAAELIGRLKTKITLKMLDEALSQKNGDLTVDVPVVGKEVTAAGPNGKS